MGKALTMASQVSCGHKPPGFVEPQSTAKLSVNGQKVLVESSIKTIGTGCTAQSQQDIPCTLVNAITAGQSAKLFTGGLAVMLDSLAGSTNGKIGVDVGQLTVVTVQARLEAS
jgi:hypothetical protein